MKFLLGLFLFAGFVAGGVSASEMLKGIEIGTIASGNPTCLDWKDADSKSIFGMGYKSDEGCTTYEGPINFGDKKLPSFALSGAYTLPTFSRLNTCNVAQSSSNTSLFPPTLFCPLQLQKAKRIRSHATPRSKVWHNRNMLPSFASTRKENL